MRFRPQAFSHAVSDAVRSMCTTDLDDRTTLNSQVFWSKLEEHLGAIDDDTRRHFDLFYANDFGRIGEGLVLTRRRPRGGCFAREGVSALSDHDAALSAFGRGMARALGRRRSCCVFAHHLL